MGRVGCPSVAMVDCHGAVDVTQPISVWRDATAAPQYGCRRVSIAAFVVFRPRVENKSLKIQQKATLYNIFNAQ